jgi:copper(I)-binding protein
VFQDTAGNVYVTGSYNSSPVTIFNAGGASFGTLTNSGNDVFIVKYNPSGIAQWATRIAGSGVDIGYGLSVDTGGNVYITGSYASSTMTIFNQGGASFGTLTNSGSSDIFVVKYNSGGIAQWTTRIAGTTADIGYGVSVDTSGNVYITGSYALNPVTIFNQGGASFGTLANSGSEDVFLVKYDSSGIAQWATRIAGTFNDIGFSISVDGSGNVYMTGSYSSNPLAIFNVGGASFGTLTNSGADDAFLVKYNSSGIAQWATKIAGAGGDYGYGVSVDISGNVYVGGAYDSSPVTIFNAGGASFGTLANSGSGTTDAFLAKYNSSGITQWVTRIAGTTFDRLFAVSVDGSGNVYVTGFYVSSPVTIFNAGGASFASLANSGNEDTFLVKYNSSGIAQWATRMSGSGIDIGRGISAGGSGSVCVVGDYTSPNPFVIYNSNGTSFGTLSGNGSVDTAIVHYDTSGTAQWATKIAGAGGDYGYGVSVDTSGNLYVTGQYESISNPLTIFNAGGASFTTLTNSGNDDVFLVKYNSSGIAQWATRIAGAGLDSARGLSVDTSGNLYIAGTIGSGSNPLTIFNNGGASFGRLIPSGAEDAFLVKYDSNGIAQWATKIGGSAADYGFGLSVDTSGNVYVAGQYASNPLTIFNNGGASFGTLTNSGSDDLFIVKYDSSGIAQWATRIAGTVGEQLFGVSVDGSANVYVTGSYQSSPLTIFNNGGASFGTLANSGSNDIFVIKYDSSGIAQWATRIAGSGNDVGRSISVDTSGNVYVTGQYASNPVTIFNQGGASFGTLTNSGSFDGFLIKYDSSGVAQWATQIAGSGSDIGYGVSVDGSGNVYVTGQYASSPVTIFNNGGASFGTLTNSGGNDMFVIKYDSSGIARWATRMAGSGSDVGFGIAVHSDGRVFVIGQSTIGAPMTFRSVGF